MIAAIIHVVLFALPFFGFIAVIGKKAEFAPLGCLSGIVLFFVISQTRIADAVPDVPSEIYNAYPFVGALFVAYCMSGVVTLISIFITFEVVSEKLGNK